MPQSAPGDRATLGVKIPSSARERAILSAGKDGEAGDVGSIVDTAGCSQADNSGCLDPTEAATAADIPIQEKGPLVFEPEAQTQGEAGSGFQTEPQLKANTRTEQLLEGIHEQLASMQREAMFEDFSIMRLVGGITQIGVFFCLLVAVWYLLSPDRPTDPILFSLGFALVLQVMSLTFTMHGRH